MKTRKTFLILMLMIYSTSIHAQFKVYSDGSVTIDRDTLMGNVRLTVGDVPASIKTSVVDTMKNIGTFSYIVPITNKYNYGLVGCASSTSVISGRSFGVMGIAGNNTTGYNYGVYGTLSGMNNGAAVYGTTSGTTGSNVSGKYAGYFKGDVVVEGRLYANSVITPSDIRLKDDIKYIGEGEGRQDIHSRLMDVHVISYKLKDINNEVGDTVTAVKTEQDEDRPTLYGVSAQELQTLFPDLVVERQDGYLAVNYMELIPMLICSVQELQREVNRLRGEKDSQSMAQNSGKEGNSTYQSLLDQCALYQNTPNPSNTQTVIRYKLPSTVTDAHIYILNLQGTLLRQVPITPTLGSVTVSLSGLEPGIYLYSLIVAGHEIDTKRMIVSK